MLYRKESIYSKLEQALISSPGRPVDCLLYSYADAKCIQKKQKYKIQNCMQNGIAYISDRQYNQMRILDSGRKISWKMLR